MELQPLSHHCVVLLDDFAAWRCCIWSLSVDKFCFSAVEHFNLPAHMCTFPRTQPRFTLMIKTFRCNHGLSWVSID